VIPSSIGGGGGGEGGGGETWSDLDPNLAPGNVAAFWKFNGDILDSGPNSLDLQEEIGAAAPAGGINLPAGGGSLGSGQNMTIFDGVNGEITVRTQLNGSDPSTQHLRYVNFVSGDSQAQLASKFFDAIDGSDLEITAVNNTSNIALTNDNLNTDGNISIQEGITGVTVFGMSGGFRQKREFSEIKGLQCLSVHQDSEALRRTGHDPALALTGPMSIWALIYINEWNPTAWGRICQMAGTSEFESNNALYLLALDNDNVRRRLIYTCEHGFGGFNSTVRSDFEVPVGEMLLVSLSRDANGTITFYMNGQKSADRFSAIPTGGNAATLSIKDGADGFINGFYGGTLITDAAHTLEDHLAMLEAVRG
jgi:hypothetical protein